MTDERVRIVAQAVNLALQMRDAGVSRSGYAKILRETVFFVWETALYPKHSRDRLRSVAAIGLPPNSIDYDHAIPMKLVIDMLLEGGPDEAIVGTILCEKVRGILITKDEHAKLRRCKLAYRMPDDWDGTDWQARYKAAKIKLA